MAKTRGNACGAQQNAAHRSSQLVKARGMINPRYTISDHAFFCKFDHHLIVLDVARDRYLCIPKAEFDLLAPCLDNYRIDDEEYSDHIALNSTETDALALELISQGILKRSAIGASAVDKVRISPPNRIISPPLSTSRLWQPLRHIATFLRASAYADFCLRRRSFARIVQTMQSRLHPTVSFVADIDLEGTSRLVAVFNSLRPIYPRDYLCLFDSLALLEFLRRYRVLANWIFAVSADPFYAHCWVQIGQVLLNDTLERTSRYRPIMCV